MKIKLVTVILSLLIFLLTAGCSHPCPDIGQSAPDFTLKSIDGKNLSLSDFRGKKIILNYWATWCGPCEFEMPFFQAVFNKQASYNAVILTINLKENATTVRNYADSKSITFPVLLDPDAKVTQLYCLPSALPITLFIDEQGVIKARKIGAFRSQAELETMLGSL